MPCKRPKKKRKKRGRCSLRLEGKKGDEPSAWKGKTGACARHDKNGGKERRVVALGRAERKKREKKDPSAVINRRAVGEKGRGGKKKKNCRDVY